MKTFMDYEELIKDTVEEFHEKDPSGWVWKVEEITPNLVKIRWGYLSYLEEEKDYFLLTLKESDGDVWVASRDPRDPQAIDGYFVVEKPTKSWEDSYESGIKACLNSIYYLATNNY